MARQRTGLNRLRRISRRELLKDGAVSLLAGVGSGYVSKGGMDYLGNKLEGIVAQADQDIKELMIDVKALYGSLDRKLAEETEILKQQYTDGRLKIYEELGIATSEEIAELEGIIKTSEDFAEHYNFAERARIFKDRLRKHFSDLISTSSSIDSKAEEYSPGFLKGINEMFRKAAPGIKSGEQGRKERQRLREELENSRKRLDALCKVYDTNEDNRTAESEVLETLNQYLRTTELSDEERELYGFLKQEYEKQGSKGHLRNFIENYEEYAPETELFMKLQASLTRTKQTYEKIEENREYMFDLQDLLREGIAMKKQIREQSPRKFAKFEQQIQLEVDKLRASVDSVIMELENKGCQIQTREEAIEEGIIGEHYREMLRDVWEPVKNIGSCIIGGLAGLLAYSHLSRTRKTRAYAKALNQAEGEITRLRGENLNNTPPREYE